MSENREINLLDLELSASAAALKLLDVPAGRPVHKASMEAFETDCAEKGFHPDLDWPHWNSRFNAQRQYYAGQRRTESESTKAWKFKAKQEAQKPQVKPVTTLPASKPVTVEDVKKSLEENQPVTAAELSVPVASPKIEVQQTAAAE